MHRPRCALGRRRRLGRTGRTAGSPRSTCWPSGGRSPKTPQRCSARPLVSAIVSRMATRCSTTAGSIAKRRQGFRPCAISSSLPPLPRTPSPGLAAGLSTRLIDRSRAALRVGLWNPRRPERLLLLKPSGVTSRAQTERATGRERAHAAVRSDRHAGLLRVMPQIHHGFAIDLELFRQHLGQHASRLPPLEGQLAAPAQAFERWSLRRPP